MSDAMNGLHADMARGAAWSAGLRLSERTLGLISTIVLARLLAPQDFGVVAMCMVVVAAMEALTMFSFDMVLIQRQDATKEHYDTAFTLKAIMGAIVGCLIAASSELVAWFYSDDRLSPIMLVLGANFFIQFLENIRVVDFRKYFQLHLEAILRIAVKVVGLAVTIPAALILRDYWALIIGMTAMSAFNVVLSYVMRPYRPAFTLRFAREILNYSGWLVLNNMVLFFRRQIHNVFIGRLLGPYALGMFNMANEIAMMSSSEIVAPINRAVYPGYAKLASDPAALRKTFLDVFALIVIVSIPAAAGIIAIAGDLVPLLLGDRWLATIPLIKLIAICGALHTLNSNMTYVVLALGVPRLTTRVAVWETILIMPLMYVATLHYGVIGAAWSLVASFCIVSTPMWWRTSSKLLDLSIVELIRRVWRPLIASTAMYVAITYLQTSILVDVPRAVAVLVAVATGLIAYVAALGLLWYVAGLPRGGEAIVVEFVRGRVLRGIGRNPA